MVILRESGCGNFFTEFPIVNGYHYRTYREQRSLTSCGDSVMPQQRLVSLIALSVRATFNLDAITIEGVEEAFVGMKRD